MLTLLKKGWDAVKDLFGGKGGGATVQVGKGNTSSPVSSTATVTATAGGDLHQHVNQGTINNYHTGQATSAQSVFEPKPEELNMLIRLFDSYAKSLIRARNDAAGVVFLVDARPLADYPDIDACHRYVLAFDRLYRHGFLVNKTENTFILSDAGSELALRHRGKCPGCQSQMVNAGTDPSRPPRWECRYHRCIRAVHHAKSKCPVCGRGPSVITDQGLNYTEFLCSEGHQFTAEPYQ